MAQTENPTADEGQTDIIQEIQKNIDSIGETKTKTNEEALSPQEITRILNFTEKDDSDTAVTETEHLQTDKDNATTTIEMLQIDVKNDDEEERLKPETPAEVIKTVIDKAILPDRSAVDSLRQASIVSESMRGTAASYPIKYEPPSHDTMTAKQIEAKGIKDAKKNVKIRFFRAVMVIAAPLVCLTVLTYKPHHFSLLVGLNIIFMYFWYFFSIFWLFGTGTRKKKGRGLFRIYSAANVAPGWVSMNISSLQLLYPNKAIQSISEFSAIHGAVPKTMLATLSAYTWAMVTMHNAAYVSFYCDFSWDIADYLELIGVSGLILIGIFELDPYNPIMKGFHYLGAGAGCGTIAGYCIQQYWIGEKLWVAILIACVAAIAFGSWQFFNWRTEKFQALHADVNTETIDSIRDEITMYSLKNVISEAIFLFLGALCVGLWIIDYNQNCHVGCRGPENPDCE